MERAFALPNPQLLKHPEKLHVQWLNAVQPENLCITEEMVQVGLQVGILSSSDTLHLMSKSVNTAPSPPPVCH